MTPQWGDPCIALRLPQNEINALRAMAASEGTTVSALIRKAIDDSLQWRAYETPVKLDGQLSIDE